MRKTKHVVMFSTGLSSAYLANWVIQTYGKENTILFFTDTLWEDEDNYRFMSEVSDHLGLPMTITADGRTPEEVFFDHRFMGNFGTAPCSKDLKMKQTVLFVENLRLQGFEPVLYFGIGFKERERSPRIAKNYAHNCLEPVKCRFPLIKLHIKGQTNLHNDYYKQVIEGEWGIKIPRMYGLGFSHANCGGRCIKGGFEHYRTLYKVWPERFKAQEEMERRFGEEVNAYTILRRNGQPFTLEQLREEIERKGSQLSFGDLQLEEDVPCACFI